MVAVLLLYNHSYTDVNFTNCSLCFLVSHIPSPPRSSQKSGRRKPRILGCTEGHLGTSYWVIVYGMRKIGSVFWIQRTKQSVSLCQHPLTSGTLMFTGSMSFPQHSKHQTNNKLLFCVCSFSLRLVAKHFVSCQWDAGTFMIVSDCICKANSIFFFIILILQWVQQILLPESGEGSAFQYSDASQGLRFRIPVVATSAQSPARGFLQQLSHHLYLWVTMKL